MNSVLPVIWKVPQSGFFQPVPPPFDPFFPCSKHQSRAPTQLFFASVQNLPLSSPLPSISFLPYFFCLLLIIDGPFCIPVCSFCSWLRYFEIDYVPKAFVFLSPPLHHANQNPPVIPASLWGQVGFWLFSPIPQFSINILLTPLSVFCDLPLTHLPGEKAFFYFCVPL